MIDGVKDEKEFYRLIALKLFHNMKKRNIERTKQEKDEDNFSLLIDIIKETYEKLTPDSDFENYRKTSTIKLKELLKSLGFSLDAFAVKSESNPNRILEYKIPKDVRPVFEVFLSAKGEMRKAISNLKNQKFDKITLEEAVEHIALVREIRHAGNELYGGETEEFKESITKKQNLRTETINYASEMADSYISSLTMPFTLKEWLTVFFGRHMNNQPDNSVDINDYDNLNPHTIIKYLSNIQPERYYFDGDDEKLIYDLYKNMIEKTSEKWLIFVLEYAKSRNAHNVKIDTLERENNERYYNWCDERYKILDDYDLSEYNDWGLFNVPNLSNEKLSEAYQSLNQEASDNLAEEKLEIEISKIKDEWVHNKLKALFHQYKDFIDDTKIDEYLKTVRKFILP